MRSRMSPHAALPAWRAAQRRLMRSMRNAFSCDTRCRYWNQLQDRPSRQTGALTSDVHMPIEHACGLGVMMVPRALDQLQQHTRCAHTDRCHAVAVAASQPAPVLLADVPGPTLAWAGTSCVDAAHAGCSPPSLAGIAGGTPAQRGQDNPCCSHACTVAA